MYNYQKFLSVAKVAGVKTHCKSSAVLACFLFSMVATYAYSFFMGSVWIYKGFPNQTFGREYTAGDIVTCFFGVVFGMFSVGMATPSIKSVAEGLAAGKMVYDIIDRKPDID